MSASFEFVAPDHFTAGAIGPPGKRVFYIQSREKGTLISIHPQRTNILRSADGGKSWQEAHSFEPAKVSGGAQGLRDGAFGYLTGK